MTIGTGRVRRWKVLAKLGDDVEMAARRHVTNCDVVERQSFFLRRREELKEEQTAGLLSTSQSTSWKLVTEQGARLVCRQSRTVSRIAVPILPGVGMNAGRFEFSDPTC